MHYQLNILEVAFANGRAVLLSPVLRLPHMAIARESVNMENTRELLPLHQGGILMDYQGRHRDAIVDAAELRPAQELWLDQGQALTEENVRAYTRRLTRVRLLHKPRLSVILDV